jgi:hypothetical protein
MHYLPIVEKMVDSLEVANSSMPHTYEHTSLTNPINLSRSSDDEKDNENPHIVISKNGNIYTVWENKAKSQILFSKSTDGGASFSSPIILNSRNGCCFAAREPEIAVSANNSIYVTWDEDYNFVVFTRSTDGGASFSEKTIWGNNGSPAINKVQLGTFNNNVYLVLFSTDSTPYPISFVTSTDGGASFSSPTILSKNETGDSQDIPWMVISKNGTINVAWYNGISNDMLISKSTDGGASFSSPIKLFERYSCSTDFKVVASGNNVYAICMIHGEEIYDGEIPGTKGILYYNIIIFTSSNNYGASFNSPIAISKKYDIRTRFPDIAATGQNVYVTWESDHNFMQDRGSDIFMRRSTDGGASFGNIIDISYDNQDSLHPSIDAFGNNVYVVWDKVTTDGNAEGRAHDETFLTQSTDNGVSFTNPIDISKDKTGTLANQRYPIIRADDNNNTTAFAIWANRDIFLVRISN